MLWEGCARIVTVSFFFKDAATNEIYTRQIVGSGRWV